MALTGVVVVVTFLLNVLQIIYGSKSVSILDTHPNIMLIAVLSFLLYCFACYLRHNLTSIFRSSTWPALQIYTNFQKFLGSVSIVSLASIIFSTSSTSLAIVYLLSALFFSGKSVLNLIQHRNSLAAEVKFPFGNMSVDIVDVELGLTNEHKRKHKKKECRRGYNKTRAKLQGEVNAKKRRAFPSYKGIVINSVENSYGIGFPQADQMASPKGKGKIEDGLKPESAKKVSLDEKSCKELVCQARSVPQQEKELKTEHKECSLRGEALEKLRGEVNAKKSLALTQKEIVINGVEDSVTKLDFPQDNQTASTKCKGKIMGDKWFNNDGLWSQEAIALLEMGKLGKMVFNLDDKVMENVSVADWLEMATHNQFHEKEKEHSLIPNAKKKSQLEGTSGCGIVEHGCDGCG